MSEPSFSEILSNARAAAGMTRQQLADAVGYSSVMIAKLESGERVPDGKRIPVLAEALGIDARELMASTSRPDRRRQSAPTVADALMLAKHNAQRARRLASSADRLVRDTDRAARDLDAAVREFDLRFVRPMSAVLAGIAELPVDAFTCAEAEVEVHPQNPAFSRLLATMQERTAKTIHALLGTGFMVGAEDPADRGAANTAYMTVASVAMAHSCAALANLSGVAFTLGGIGFRSAGGGSVATATRLRTRMVGTRVELATSKAAREAGGRTLSTQQSIRRDLEAAESELSKGLDDLQQFASRASDVKSILTFALKASRFHTRIIENAVPTDGEIGWSALGASAQASIRRMAEIMLACLTCLALPVSLSWSQALPEDALGTRTADTESTARTELSYDVGAAVSELEAEFIDFAIQVAFAQVAR